jgi:hypothetical protein
MIQRHVQITLALLFVAVISIGMYLYRLQRKEEHMRRAMDARPIIPPVTGEKTRITLAIPYDEDGVFRHEETLVPLPGEPAQRSRDILRALIGKYTEKPSPHPLNEGADINDVYLVNGDLAVVDMNSALVENHPSGIMIEDFTLFSLVETLSANMPQIKRVKFIVNGHERLTLAGHADLRVIFDTNLIHQTVEALK